MLPIKENKENWPLRVIIFLFAIKYSLKGKIVVIVNFKRHVKEFVHDSICMHRLMCGPENLDTGSGVEFSPALVFHIDVVGTNNT